MSTSLSLSLSCLSFTFLILFIAAQAVVPASKTFKFINDGSFGEYDNEYGANYRLLGDIQTPPFALCFYNTTPNAYTFGLRMGSRPEDSTSNIMRWIWDANRGKPVRDNATLTFGANGNLVLADADGKLVWQTDTAGKGVVGLELRSNGNLVLIDNRGRFVWQSFDYPTDTVLVGQGLRAGASLVSRVSNVDGSRGPYSLVLEKQRIALYVKSKNSPRPTLYYTAGNIVSGGSTISRVVFNSVRGSFVLMYDYYIGNSATPASSTLAKPQKNSTLSFLRLESDGNLRIHTYDNTVIFNSWGIAYTLFNRTGRYSVSECKLPTKCGSLGICMNNECVGCPTQNGVISWSETCAAPKLLVCKTGATEAVNYYKVVGVEHFSSEYTQGDGPLKVSECIVKCSNECGCLGFFYREETSKCLLANELGALSRVSTQSHVAYIKTSK